MLLELGCSSPGGAPAAGLGSAGGASCLCPGPLDPAPSSGLPWPLSLAEATHHTGSLASLPSFVLAFPLLYSALLVQAFPSLSIGFFPCALEDIREHRTPRHVQSCPSCSLVPASARCSPLLVPLCPWQPLADTELGRKEYEASGYWPPEHYLQQGPWTFPGFRRAQPGPCGSPSCLQKEPPD